MLDISRSVACSSRTTVTGPWRENPLQRLDLERSNSTCRLPHLTVNRLYNWPPCCHRVVRRAGFHPKDFSNAWASGRWVHRCQLCLRLPALGPYSHRGRGVRWNIHDSRIVSERVLNRTKLFARAFFSRESDASNFEILPRIFKGVAIKIFSFSCFVSLWILSCNLQLINERYSIVFKFFNGNGENSFILKERGNYSEYFKLSSKTGTICF